MRLFHTILVAAAALVLDACGGGNTLTGAASQAIAGTAANVATATVNAGPAATANVNTLYTSVTVCAPGSTTNCQTIDGIAIDSGASGLRLMASVLSPALAAALPLQVDGTGNTLVECAQYIDGYNWGPLATADMRIAGESAASLTVQIVGASQYPDTTVPGACAGIGPSLDSVASFGANGTLGVAVLAQDCGSACALSLDPTINPGFYYACSSPTQCVLTTVTLAKQVPNPVTHFATDNNGVIVELASVAAAGASSVTGAIVFGIDTQSNNASGSATVLTVDPVAGFLTTQLNGQTYPESFFDTGSNGLYFDDSSLTQCTDLTAYYCPSGTTNFSATLLSTNNVAKTVPFSVANADTLGAGDPSLVAFSNLAGPLSMAGGFDWGLPFFYGRNVYNVIEGHTTTVGTGPYVAF
jgi:hypothetical protein